MVIYTLYFFRNGKQRLENIADVKEHRNKITFIFTNGSTLDVLRSHLLHYELQDSEASANEECVQDVFKRFDDFVSNFVYQVEQAVNSQSRYSISVNEITNFKTLLNNCRKPHLKQVISLKP